jgi:hypothetical protein
MWLVGSKEGYFGCVERGCSDFCFVWVSEAIGVEGVEGAGCSEMSGLCCVSLFLTV